MNKEMEQYQGKNGTEEIDLYDLINILWRHKMTIFITTLVIFLGGTVVSYKNYEKTKSVKGIIEYSYSGISEGQLPDGKYFSTYRIFPTFLLNKIYKKFELQQMGITYNDFSEAIRVSGIVPNDINKKIENASKNGEKYVYVPSRYAISFHLTKDTELDAEILSALVSDYILDFRDKYRSKNNIPLIDKNSIDGGWDYSEYLVIFENTVKSIRNSLKLDKELGFKSRRLGLTYSDLNLKLENISLVELNAYDSFIKKNNLTKNVEFARVKYENEIEKYIFEKDRLSMEAASIRKVIDSYKPVEKNIVVPNLSGENLNLVNSDNYYSKLTEKYLNTLIEIDGVDANIKRLKNNMDELKVPSKTQIERVDHLIKDISGKLNTLIEETNIINEEYEDKKLFDIVRVIAPVEVVKSYSKAITILLGSGILGVFLGIFLALIKEFIDNYRKTLKY